MRPEWAVDVEHTGGIPPQSVTKGAKCFVFTTGMTDVATGEWSGKKWAIRHRVDCYARLDSDHDQLWVCSHIHSTGKALRLDVNERPLRPAQEDVWAPREGQAIWCPVNAAMQALHLRLTHANVEGFHYNRVLPNWASIDGVRVPMLKEETKMLDEAAIRAEIQRINSPAARVAEEAAGEGTAP